MKALQQAIQKLTQEKNQNPALIKNMLKEIRLHIDQSEKTIEKQQFILLYNIAEVSGQLLKQIEIFRLEER